jgi:hypothetical protein
MLLIKSVYSNGSSPISNAIGAMNPKLQTVTLIARVLSEVTHVYSAMTAFCCLFCDAISDYDGKDWEQTAELLSSKQQEF